MSEILDLQKILEGHISHFLGKREPPKTFCPSEVARALTTDDLEIAGFSSWRETMPMIRTILSTMRDNSMLEILQKGVVLKGNLGSDLENVVGPIRVRRVTTE
ncbi:hypothetical protein ACMFMG_007421 [Clarireedia jacksonii]